jgi:hypothetical protein
MAYARIMAMCFLKDFAHVGVHGPQALSQY